MLQYLKQYIAIFLFFFLVQNSQAQRTYTSVQDVPVRIGENQLKMPWAGGLNSPILQTADLTGNGLEELITFDRTSRSLMVFINRNNEWHSQPGLICLLPPDISNWFLMKDYDGDGQKDIFTFTSAGIRVFRNVSPIGSEAAWELAVDFLTYQSNDREVNLLVNSSDLPAIEDVDGDGDLDVLSYDPSGGGGLEYYLNRSVETTGTAGLQPFVKESSRWGGLSECDCGEFAYNYERCLSKSSGQRVMHAGGKSLLLFDVDEDGDFDLLNGFEECTELYYLENKGSNTDPVFDGFATILPGSSEEVQMKFPAAFNIPAGNTDVQDLVVSTQISRSNNLEQDHSQSILLFRQEQTSGAQAYKLQTKSYLQDEMIDAGESSVPAFLDMDADGDLDLLLGAAGKPVQESYYGTLRLYRNTGNAEEPAFDLDEDDFLDISSLQLMQLHHQVMDFNKDGSQDLILMGTEREQYRRKVFLLLNEAEPGAPASFRLSKRKELTTPINMQLNPFFYDINEDGAPDLLVGKFDGSLSLYENTGTEDMPQFGNEIKNFLGLGLDNYRRPLVPSVGDLTGNGQPDLLLADGTGGIRFISNFLHDEGNAVPEEFQFCEGKDENAGTQVNGWLGRKSWPVVAQLRTGKSPMVAIGNLTGGLWLLETNELPATPSEGELELLVYPNPLSLLEEELVVATNLPAKVLLLSVTGQKLMEIQLEGNKKSIISLPELGSGLYVVQAHFHAGGRLSRKLIILK